MKALKWLVGSSLTLLASSAAMAYSDIDWALRPYVGVDAQIRRMDFKGGFGDNLLQHHAPQVNLYGGLRLTEFLALEAGYKGTTTRARTVTVTTDDIIMGTPLRVTQSPAIYKSKAKIKGPHVDLVGAWRIYDGAPVRLFASIGVANLKLTVLRRTLLMAQTQMNTLRTFSQRKTVLRVTGGLEYMYTEHWGFRGNLGWVNTNKLIVNPNDTGRMLQVKPKNSTSYSLGTFWLF